MGLTRIRAEVGPPTHEMFVANPRYFLTDVVGTRRLPQGSLTMIALYRTFNRGCRAHPTTRAMLEGFKMADASNMARVVGVMLLTTVVGSLRRFGRI